MIKRPVYSECRCMYVASVMYVASGMCICMCMCATEGQVWGKRRTTGSVLVCMFRLIDVHVCDKCACIAHQCMADSANTLYICHTGTQNMNASYGTWCMRVRGKGMP